MRGDALVRSTTKKDHHLSTETASLNAAKDRLARVPIFKEIADDRFIEVVGKALQVCPQLSSPPLPLSLPRVSHCHALFASGWGRNTCVTLLWTYCHHL